MYSDKIEETKKTSATLKKKGITPLQQLHKLVTSAAKFDKEMDEKIVERGKPFRRNRISVDKTLLHNHLRHTNTHNRLKEENEMWEMFENQKKVPLKSRIGDSSLGSMYSDREPGRTKVHKLLSSKRTPTTHIRKVYHTDFGKYTKKLLELKEKDDSKWGHGGFKEMYADQLERPEKTRKNKKLHTITDSSCSDNDSDNDGTEISRKSRKHKKLINNKSIKRKKERSIDLTKISDARRKSLKRKNTIKINDDDSSDVEFQRQPIKRKVIQIKESENSDSSFSHSSQDEWEEKI